jgi:Deacetylases, including yeast histone deacetylase and acetoin utilization protein
MASVGRPVLISSELFRTSRHPPGHPLAIPRVSLAIDVSRELGWLGDHNYREAVPATADQIARYHDPDYVAAVRRAERQQSLSEAESRRFNLGINGNPIFGEVFRRPATACGASLQAASLLTEGGIVYSPAGGTHHAARDHASGYCIFNDAVLAIVHFLAIGLDRVFYMDLDAHFGDGVQAAFTDDDRVFTLSVHEAGRWPMARDDPYGHGSAFDRAGGAARNFPVPPEFNDCELAWLMEQAILPLIERFRPHVIVAQCGADALTDDPMTKMRLSNRALWAAIAALVGLSPRLLVLGGGGYNPWAVARCWAGVWGTLNALSPPERLPASAEQAMRAVCWSHRLGRQPAERWLTTLADPPSPGAVRSAVKALARAAIID